MTKEAMRRQPSLSIDHDARHIQSTQMSYRIGNCSSQSSSTYNLARPAHEADKTIRHNTTTTCASSSPPLQCLVGQATSNNCLAIKHHHCASKAKVIVVRGNDEGIYCPSWQKVSPEISISTKYCGASQL
jgi:hypothetical protein